MKVIATEKIPIKMWLDDLEEDVLQQVKNLANLPFSFSHIAVMPDSHFGYGMPIGGVLATKGVVIPNAVGVDIGCGMCFMSTKLRRSDIKDMEVKLLMGEIRNKVPLGFDHHKEKQPDWLTKEELEASLPYIVTREYQDSLKQIGTLGGGNHFIEIQVNQDGYICAMIHSGSRNIGHKVASYYNDCAKELNEMWHTSVDSKKELAFLPLGSGLAEDYLEEMNICVRFAKENRARMMESVRSSMNDIFRGMQFDRVLDISHNYAAMENHFGQNVIVHRKGATKAYKGELGIIPGSQGTNSYIVEGLGNPDSFRSCSHGAGRAMGRKQAQKLLNLEEQKKLLDDKGIIHSVRNTADLDEAPGAYKDIDVVMKNQEDLVKIVDKLTPIAVIKG